MKLMALLIGLAFAVPSLADTITPLPFVPPPPEYAGYHPGQSRCAATGFTATGITGVCQYAYGVSTRYHPLPTVLYRVVWDLQTLASSLGAQCAYTTTLRQYVGDGCKVNFDPTGTVVVFDQVPYYYVSSNGPDELVSSNAQSFLITS
jgi:hypothetical protein